MASKTSIVLVLSGVLFSAPFFLGAAAHIASFVFITELQNIAPGEISGPLTVQAQDSGGTPAKADTTLCLGLFSSGGGEFSSNKDNWKPVNVLTINTGWTSRTFYYKSQTVGTHKINAKISVKPEGTTCTSWPENEWSVDWSASQNITVGDGASDEEANITPPAVSIPVPSTQPASPVPQIKAYAREDREAVVGSVVSFLGYATGLEGKPLENARFWWNFGDGDTKEGRSVSHVYQFPGKYTVGLHVSSGSYAASDYLLVTVVPNQLVIAGVLQGENGFLRLRNNAEVGVEIGGWSLEDGSGSKFLIPTKTYVGGSSEISFPNSVTGLLRKTAPVSVRMFYPDGKEVTIYWPSSPSVAESEKTTTIPSPVTPSSEVLPLKTEAAAILLPASPQDSGKGESKELARTTSSLPGNPALFLIFAAALSLMAAAGFVVSRIYGKT